MKLPTFAAFRAVAALACAAMLAASLTDALSSGPAAWRAAAQAGHMLPAAVLRIAGDDLRAGQVVYSALLVLAFAGFAFALWRCTRSQAEQPITAQAALLAVQVLLGGLVESDLLYLVAAELPFVLSTRAALRWLAIVSAVLALSMIPLALHAGSRLPRCNVAGIELPSQAVWLALEWSMEAAFQLFAFCIGHVAATRMRSRRAIAALHEELNAAQVLLEQSLRAAEQERIAHRLHEVLAQHLAALNLQLELAARQVHGPAQRSVQTSRQLAQQLVSEVRAAVSAEQKLPPVELRTALLALCEGLPAPRIELLCDDSTAGVPPAIAHTLFRVVQEAISNCIRHAGASLMRVRLSGCGDAVTLQVQDNGTGARGTMEQAGSGLRGMRERVERHGGRLSAGNRPEGGFSLTVWLPLAGQA